MSFILDNRNMQGGFLGVGMENKRNISVISMNGGNMNFEMQAPYESDEESTDVLDTDLTSSHERYASRAKIGLHDPNNQFFIIRKVKRLSEDRVRC